MREEIEERLGDAWAAIAQGKPPPELVEERERIAEMLAYMAGEPPLWMLRNLVAEGRFMAFVETLK